MIKSVRFDRPGDPDVMRLEEIALPEPGEGEVRVRHGAAGVNFIDTYHRTGLYPIPLPSGLGLEAAGTVEAVGPGVSGIAEGQRVAYCSGPPGAYAEAHVVKADRLVALPDDISDDQAAASLLKGLTVQYLIRQIHRCSAGETILFHAGAGGVGQLAIQWLKQLGCTVITTAGSEQKAEIARKLGADHVILYRQQDVAPVVREITGGRGVPVVYDGVGKDTWIASLDSLQTRGLMVSFGNASGPVKDVDIGILAQKGSLFVTRPTLVHFIATREQLREAADDFFAAVKDGVAIDRPTAYPLADAVRAHQDLEGRKTTGSLVLKP